ncbi:MAG TPA: FUSC family protein [Bdellovibrionota bacterium]|jgi:uncharacterized membrane protein YccC|nr:FUSC family protein [Bdellovibrionota bacterium]
MPIVDARKYLRVYSVRNYLQKSLKLETTQARISRMVLCGLATSVPLFVGLALGYPTSGIYGALIGYFLTLNDHFGPIKHRVIVLTLTFLMILSGASLGILLGGQPITYSLVLAVLVYWIGLMGGEGAELERAILFATIEMIVTYYSPSFSVSRLPPILGFSLMGYVFVTGAAVVHSRLSKKPPESFARLTDSLKGPLASPEERHLHALSYMIITMLSLCLVDYYEIQRGYWAVITVLLVMKPGRRNSLNRSFQRFFGTGLGVIATEPLIYVIKTPAPIMLLIGLCSALVPWASKKNYWLTSVLTSMVVILLLDLAAVERGDFLTPLLRLENTIIGCLLGAGGVLISKLLSEALLAWRRRRQSLNVHAEK